MIESLLYEEMLDKARHEHLAEFIVECLYSKNLVKVDFLDDIEDSDFLYIIQDNPAHIQVLNKQKECIIDIDETFVNDRSNEDYVMHQNELYLLSETLQYILDSDEVYFVG